MLPYTTERIQPFSWTDASTKVFLSMYRKKLDLLSSKKLRTRQFIWKKISEEMRIAGYNVSPLQVKNKYKTMVRAFKKTITQNAKTGAQKSCSFQKYVLQYIKFSAFGIHNPLIKFI